MTTSTMQEEQLELARYVRAGAISQADADIAARLCELVGESDPLARLACAITVAVTAGGSVCWNLGSSTLEGLEAADGLHWPDAGQWQAVLERSPLVTSDPAPLVLSDGKLYLDRYARAEQRLADSLLALRDAEHQVDEARLARGLDQLFPTEPVALPDGTTLEPDRLQRAAAQAAVTRKLSVIAGGPGTGKTSTIARIFALLADQAESRGRMPMIALAAPTGRAAARLQEAVAASSDFARSQAAGDLMHGAQALTLHRLLRWQPFNQSRFRHNHDNPLPYDVVIVDECSMISLTLMQSLVDAMAPDSQLVLVGDPQQLASVDAGTVFGDVVGATTEIDSEHGIVVLRQVHRFGEEIAALSEAILAGDSEQAIRLLRTHQGCIRWIETEPNWADDPEGQAAVKDQLLEQLAPTWLAMIDNAESAKADQAVQALSRARLLCAHRRGPYGAAGWNYEAFRYLATLRPLGFGADKMFPGRPLIVTQNDYELGIYNGDTAVVIAQSNDTARSDDTVQSDNTAQSDDTAPSGETLAAVFSHLGPAHAIPAERLGHLQPAYASTVHKSQGSQFDTVVTILPPADSKVLGRQLLYTAITRARHTVVICGSEESLRAAIARPDLRTSGLRHRLWPQS